MNRQDLVSFGEITAAHGIKGHMKVRLFTDFPERIPKIKMVYTMGSSAINGPYRVLTARLTSADRAILSLDGITSPETACTLRGLELAVPKNEIPPLPEGRYYYFQLVGLDVYSDEGEYLGVLERILPFPANDVYVVRTINDKELLLPATKEVVRVIDLKVGQMKVRLLPGLR